MFNVEEMLAKMSVEDKIRVCYGKDFWHTRDMEKYGLPSIMVADGPHGLRKQEDTGDMLGINRSVPATCFPTAVLSACSFNEELLQEMGAAIGAEAKSLGVNVVLGPGANIKRNPLCGRNFEYFSEDPYVSGKLAGAFIEGVQGEGVGTCIKHFAMNNQEYKRFSSNSMVDDRAMREIYLAGFEMAMKEHKPSSVMCSYNKINGTHASDNEWLLTQVLRKEWGYEGTVITDWGAMNNRIKGFKAGCDLLMPGGSDFMLRECVEAYRKGELTEEEIDACARRVLEFVSRSLEMTKATEKDMDFDAHYEVAKKVALEGAVLLKNEGSVLPLAAEDKVAFVGYMAKEPRYQGAGSSHINPWRLTGALEALGDVIYAQGCNEDGTTDEELLREATEVARAADKAVVFIGLTDSYESEGFDRSHMKLPEGHEELLKAVWEANKNVIVVLTCGSVVELPWFDEVMAVLYMGLGGEAVGEATKALLYGEVTPSGRLAEAWPLAYEDCITESFYGDPHKDAQYRESIYVGYRYYETANVPVRFPFGYGLSYTSFTYSDLQVQGDVVTCKVKNSGAVAGAEVVQLYVEGNRDVVYRPVRELKGFTKVYLEPGQEKEVRFELTERSFAIWNGGWSIPSGYYDICIGRNSHEMVLRETILVPGDPVAGEAKKEIPAWYNTLEGVPTKEDFEALYGRKVETILRKKGEYTMENTVLEMSEESFIMRILYRVVESIVAKDCGGKKDYNDPAFRMQVVSAVDASLNGMKINAGMNNYVLEGLLEMVNGHFLRGICTMCKKNKW